MKPSALLSFLFVAILALSAKAQNWQNITYQKGGYALSNIVQDSKGHLYVFCPTGMYTSTNNGNNWSKLGKNIVSTIRQVRPSFHLSNYYKVMVVKDTVHLFIRRNTNDVHESIFFDKENNVWKRSGRTLPVSNNPFNLDLFEFNGTIAYLAKPSPTKFFNHKVLYSSDGMKTWKSKVLRDSNATSNVLDKAVTFNNKLFVFNSNLDTAFVTTNGIDFSKKVLTPNTLKSSNWEMKVSKENIFLYSIKRANGGPNTNDSLVAYRLDTLSYRWVLQGKSKYEAILPKRSFGFSKFRLTQSGYLYEHIGYGQQCYIGFRRTKDWGLTWEQPNFQNEPATAFVDAPAPPFQEIGGKTYLLTSKWLIQNTSSESSLTFSYTSPTDFGYQLPQYEYTASYSKNYVGNHTDATVCTNNAFSNRYRWNGAWQTLTNPDLSTADLSLTLDEGLTYQLVMHPSKKKEAIQMIPLKGTLYAIFSYSKSDTLFVSTDVGKTWQVKKAAYTDLGTGYFEAFFDSKGDDLFLFHRVGQNKKIYMSKNGGNSWTDVTYDLPANTSFDSYTTLIRKNFKQPTIEIIPPNPTYYIPEAFSKKNYMLDEAAQSWKLLDSNTVYYQMDFEMDTSIRETLLDKNEYLYSKLFKTELSFDNKTWTNLNPTIAPFETADTLVYTLGYNAKGLYMETNYGLYYTPYSNITTGLHDLESIEAKNSYTLYPNPSSSSVQILPSGETVALQLTNLQGQGVLSLPVWDTEKPIDLSSLTEGIYFLKIKGKQEKVIKLVKR